MASPPPQLSLCILSSCCESCCHGNMNLLPCLQQDQSATCRGVLFLTSLRCHMLNSFENTWICMCISDWSYAPKWHRQLNFFLKEFTDLPILPNQYYGCWWHGNTMNQGIGTQNIDLVCLEWFGCLMTHESWRFVKTCFWIMNLN